MRARGAPSPGRVAVVPVALIVAGVVLAVVVPEIDRRLEVDIGLERDPDSARSALSATASGMIAFTGFVFSAVVRVVQFGSSAFSPRLLRVLRGDLLPRLALGVFTATFLYALVLTQNFLQIVRRLRALLEDLHAALPEKWRPAIEERLARLEIGDRQGLGSRHPVREAPSSGG